ncbi:MAG: 4Fe-4S binding protein [Anaerolineae bacterium]|nr:4Fe-4S binding protein [Anaerolineae bacterium]
MLASLLLFPVSLYYFSPAIILQAASEGVVNGSMIVFALMFVSALFVGRLWCGWACPAGALQEFGAPINDKPVPRQRLDWIKWAIWLPWLGGIIALAIGAGGLHTVNPFYQLEGGVTLALVTDPGAPPWFLIYYIIVALFLGLALLLGRRAGCHTVCWMAPFMILGRWIRNVARWPALRLKAAPDRCADCGRCTRYCPMSLDVNAMVARGDMEAAECILCGNCVDTCQQGAIQFSFDAGRQPSAPSEETSEV